MSAPSYAALADVKAAMNIPATTTQYDADLNQKLDTASRAIEQATARRFYPDLNSDGTPNVSIARRYVPTHPGYCIIDDLLTFTSLQDAGGMWVLDRDFYLEPENAPFYSTPYTAIRTIARPFIFTQAQVPVGWAGFDGRVTVTGQWGWTTTPPEIVAATELLTRRLFTRFHDAPLGVVQLGSEAEATRIARTDPDIGSLIGPYTLVVIA